MVQPQKRKKKQSMETSAMDSQAVTNDQRTVSTKEKSGNDHRRGARAEKSRLWSRQLGVKYEAKSLGHRVNDVGNDSPVSTHRKADIIEAMIGSQNAFPGSFFRRDLTGSLKWEESRSTYSEDLFGGLCF